jgi:hypothetical protein
VKVPVPPESTRFFARVESAWLACPRCGRVLHFSTTAQHQVGCTWNPRTARLKCRLNQGGCGLTFVVGLMLWPVQKGGIAQTIPVDHVPHERELAQMRAMEGIGKGSGAGWWMSKAQAKRSWRPDDTNVTAGCTCKPSHGALGDVDCPLHGVREYEGEDPWPR